MEHHIEVLAMNIKLGLFGERVLRQEWIDWALANPTEAQALRDQAEAMIGVAMSHAKQKSPKPRMSNHHSLGWLLHG